MWPNTCSTPKSLVTFGKCGTPPACAGTLGKAGAPPQASSSGEMARVRMRAAQGVFRGKGHVAGLVEAALPRRTLWGQGERQEREESKRPSGTSPI